MIRRVTIAFKIGIAQFSFLPAAINIGSVSGAKQARFLEREPIVFPVSDHNVVSQDCDTLRWCLRILSLRI